MLAAQRDPVRLARQRTRDDVVTPRPVPGRDSGRRNGTRKNDPGDRCRRAAGSRSRHSPRVGYLPDVAEKPVANEEHRFCGRDVQLVVGKPEERAEQYNSDAFFTVCNYEQVLRDITSIESWNRGAGRLSETSAATTDRGA